MAKFWTSDHHFGHKNIIKYCNRPFTDVEDMREGLIKNWNEVVKPGDEVYVLGDFSFHKGSKSPSTSNILRRLNGQKFLIAGNHDYDKKNWEDDFVWIKYQKNITVDGQKIVMSHYPFLTWAGNNRGVWNLHGHMHSANPWEAAQGRFGRSFDVGVDGNGYYPWAFADLKVILDKLPLPDYRHARGDGDSL